LHELVASGQACKACLLMLWPWLMIREKYLLFTKRDDDIFPGRNLRSDFSPK
jgi:hypothetical protein